MTNLNPATATAVRLTDRLQAFWNRLSEVALALDFDRNEALELQVARLEAKVQNLELGSRERSS